ncbi:MAG TPA: class I SAM-dependent methyltransferase [Anaerohalosphaeraceae bacterium]|nr:class I SAM-dependent methyltransferase [Anaerohalosphaeraceae bacterium]HOL89928.1 class I SAM-dependent methyltransferase [Anaerohalosphaeraceae bacterium]HPP57256.1 class I SAM-dependent methyltransferase [Anaerohalosphaeraceae bacterium]
MNRQLLKVLTAQEFRVLSGIEGHLSDKEVLALFYFVYFPKEKGSIVEIGSFKGKSTIVLASGLKKAGRTEKVFAVDPHLRGSYEVFLENLRIHSVHDTVCPLRMTSEEAAKQWNEPIRPLFVDGSHLYEDVLLDIQLWEPWVIRNGLLIFHDTGVERFDGVRRAVEEAIVSCGRFRELLCLKNMRVFRKRW